MIHVFIDVTWSIRTDVGVLQEKRIDDSWSIRADICQILAKISQNSLCWKKNLQKDTRGPGEVDNNSNKHQTRSCMARSLDENW